MGRASYIRMLKRWPGDARLYEVDPPISYGRDAKTRWVIVSTMWLDDIKETVIYAADESGHKIWSQELYGSIKGAIDPIGALLYAGYKVEV